MATSNRKRLGGMCSECGKLGVCKLETYCSKECQVAAWPSHKSVCSIKPPLSASAKLQRKYDRVGRSAQRVDHREEAARHAYARRETQGKAPIRPRRTRLDQSTRRRKDGRRDWQGGARQLRPPADYLILAQHRQTRTLDDRGW